MLATESDGQEGVCDRPVYKNFAAKVLAGARGVRQTSKRIWDCTYDYDDVSDVAVFVVIQNNWLKMKPFSEPFSMKACVNFRFEVCGFDVFKHLS